MESDIESPPASRLDGLPADLRAVLTLLLGHGRGYAEIAATLHIKERAVRDRAHAALALLAPREARPLTATQRELVGEHMLGQADAAGERAALAELRASAPARAWARALAAELEPLAAGPLPEIPAVPPPPTPPALPISRRGGAIVLSVLAAVVVVVVLFVVVGVGGGSHGGAHAAGSTTSGSGTTSTTSTSGLHVSATLPLKAPNPASKAVGLVDVASSHGELGFVMAAEHLPPTQGFKYAAWLYNSPSEAVLLGLTVSSSGTLKAIGLLPSDASRYQQIVLTEEHSEKPTRPGTIVLSGAFKTG
jgi:plasmid stabilization system protein ParE